MKSRKLLLTATILLSLTICSSSVMAFGGKGNNRSGCPAMAQGAGALISTMPLEELSQEERASILKMREEEKLARDVYTFLYNTWQAAVFANISRSEQRHMDAVETLLVRYSIDDPVAGLDYGEFSSPEMQQLYNDLTAQGSVSLEQALQVGATIEDLDIKDLEEARQTVDNDDIMTVFQNLEKGSRNHMRAFVTSLQALGSSYTAQYLTQEEVDSIVDSDWERGPLDKDGNPVGTMGRGRGHWKNGGGCRGCSGQRGAGFVDNDGDGICDNR